MFTSPKVVSIRGGVSTFYASENIAQWYFAKLSDSAQTISLADASDGISVPAGLMILPVSNQELGLIVPEGSVIYTTDVLEPGRTYYLNTTGISYATYPNLVSNDYVVEIGFALTANTLELRFKNHGVQI